MVSRKGGLVGNDKSFRAGRMSTERERTRTGLEAARQLGRKGRRKRKMTDSKIAPAKTLLANGVPPRDVAKSLGVSVLTLYRWLPACSQA